jgi:two-component system, cell cycle sensor histidine kinase and response regulator CckA
LAFARRQLIEPRSVDLNSLVLEASSLLERVLGETIQVAVELCPQPLPVKVDPSQISQLLLNLALNARDAMPGGGRLTFRTALLNTDDRRAGSVPELSAGRYVALSIIDTGEGLSDEVLAHLFEPFFTTKDFGKGTGLGLAMCYGIVKQNSGHIAVESALGTGTAFTVYLPQSHGAVEPARAQRTSLPVAAGNETLLFVEDDDLLRHLMVPELTRHGYRLIEASNGEEALKAATEHAGPIHLLVTDMIMPKMSGVELARRFTEMRPQTPVLFISGYTHDTWDGEPLANLLFKPFAGDALLSRVRQLLDTRVSAR